jgi:hypothetical protein
MNAKIETDEVGEDLVVLRVQRRTSAGGAWVTGTLAGHKFEALVFAEHAENPEWELGDSRISKLWVQRRDGRWVVFHWERGPAVAPVDELAQAVVDFLAGGLATLIFGEASHAA